MAPPTITLPRRAKGPKPQFFRDPVMDHLMAMVIALTAELSVTIERQDTLERLLDNRQVLPRKDIEAYRPDDAVEGDRFKTRDDLIGRVFQVLHEQAELAETMNPKAKLPYVADERGAILGPSEGTPARKTARKTADKTQRGKKRRR
ncbi:MAG: hypothetical protein EXQ85_08780 [Alphaproteobacteria bacterium]|nr:hypothetical protein [Alphaproteobacteria bacterium]